jgi:4a-hydroxytetrahydrobiopterin dehydratase
VALSEDEILRRLPPGWTYEGGAIRRTLSFPTYRDGVAFAVKAALLAERRDHHPELHIGYGKVTVELSTHSAGGVTEKDLELARAFDSLL